MLLATIAAIAMSTSAEPPRQAVKAPAPAPRQLAWQKLETYAFVHFGPNTFTDNEWGEGREDPKVFHPSALDTDQWVRAFKDAGMTQVVITAKHHDGFCLWPSKFSTHTVAQSNWRNGQGDVLADLRKSCAKYGLKMGVYLSPWDRNHPTYGTPEYNRVFASMLEEVLTRYGPIHEVWFDGANGEGPNGKRQVYDWDLFISTVRKRAPEAVIFSDAGPDIRWVGNEAGIAGETCWSMIDKAKVKIGAADTKYLNAGDRDGSDWVPAECDVSIRPGWFYHASEDEKVKSPAQLLDLYEHSVGRNGALLLNVPPDRRGLIHEADVAALKGFRRLKDATYGRKVGGPYTAIEWEPGARESAAKAVDERAGTYWTPRTASASARLEILLAKETLVDRIALSEPIENGQHIEAFSVTALVGAERVTLATGTTIGAKRILRFAPKRIRDVQIHITKSKGPIAISDIGFYATPNAAQDEALTQLKATREQRLKWWREARFGMFIHWGLYAIPAGSWKGNNYAGASEWLMYSAQIPVQDYLPLQKQFNPHKFDAERWVQIAKDAGMKYIVITSKHHDGFALFDSKLTDWDIMNTPFGRDVLKELAAACKKGGIRLCFYHSIMDWTHPDYGLRRPWDKRPEIPTNMDRYTQFMKGQLKELLTQYGDIGILWFDGEWEPEAWTHERGVDLYRYVLSLQPKIIVNNRVDVHRSGMAGMSANAEAVGDYGTPEQEIPANGMPGVDWESCMTMNGSWGYHAADHNWKSAQTLVHNLIDCASKGGNYLLNVGPDALGEIPAPSVERLAKVGSWLRRYGESIYGTEAGPFPKPLPWGRVTRRGSVLYAHVFDPAATEIELYGLKGKIARLSEIGRDGGGSLMMRLGKTGPIVPLPTDGREAELAGLPRVFAIEMEGAFSVEPAALRPDAKGILLLPAIEAVVEGSTARYESGADKQCIGFWTQASDVVKWEVDLPAGTYAVEIDLACETGSSGATFAVEIGGATLKGAVPDTGGWSSFRTLKLGSLTVSTRGRQAVRVRPLSKPGAAVMNLRAIRLTRTKD